MAERRLEREGQIFGSALLCMWLRKTKKCAKAKGTSTRPRARQSQKGCLVADCLLTRLRRNHASPEWLRFSLFNSKNAMGPFAR